MINFLSQLKQFGRARSNVLLSKHTTFKIGGPAKFFIEVIDGEKLINLLNFLQDEGIEYFILGGGSNILFSDEGFDGVVVKIQTSNFKIQDETIVVDAGTSLAKAVVLASEHSLTGLEWAVGIPGTVGGAVRGNAGAMGSDTACSLDKVEVWKNGEIFEFNNQECNFSYRASGFKYDSTVILRVWLKLAIGDKTSIVQMMQDYITRRSKRIAPYPSAGSFFKNIKMADYPNDKTTLPPQFLERGMVPAGWLIEECGLRGLKQGGAMVSNEHGNFIINYNNQATQADVLQLVEKVQDTVYNKFKVDLEPETEIVK